MEDRKRADICSKCGIRFKWREGKNTPNVMYRFNDECLTRRCILGIPIIIIYDVASHNWSQLPDSPYSDCSLVIVKTMLTTVGGLDHRFKITNKLFSLTGDGKEQTGMMYFHQCQQNVNMQLHFLLDHNYLIVAGGLERKLGTGADAGIQERGGVKLQCVREARAQNFWTRPQTG